MDELLVFDLDGTLIDADERISDVTRRALHELDQRGIAWTVATGRMPHGAREALPELRFRHPQAYKNGVLIWDLNENARINAQAMDPVELLEVCRRLDAHGINPWLNTLDHDDRIGAYIQRILTDREKSWARYMESQSINVQLREDFAGIEEHVLNIFAITDNAKVLDMAEELADVPGVQVYAGPDMYHQGYYWMDIHHISGTKGDAVKFLQRQTGARRLVCFGDSDNDISMFKLADEAYAMDNGLDELKAVATDVIGHHTDHAIAHFLADRYGFRL
ncbi:HAD-IIB family hydrolase [Saccharospirillum salsuginis]|uniref:Haloacid dehalogenase n=1 Tax=Saccharospirillum salsuginis TaxID=418750 RepID=A0A918N6H7_9GAMM|nr:HAD-IIB family hydrolase [Saccharospirillum salsuginis]GGX43440.1 haloacid dehalogenase [Saccharospirillum salsuginis]